MDVNMQGDIPLDLDHFFLVHADLVEMFQDLDFHQIFRDYGHMSTEALGSYIVEHMAAMPRKRKVDAANPQPIQSPSKASQRRGKKRKAAEISDAPGPSTRVDEYSDEFESSVSDDEFAGDLLIDKMFGEMTKTLTREIANPDNKLGVDLFQDGKKLLSDKFPSVRSEFIRMAYRAFDTNFVATALACFFNQSGYTQKLHGVLNNLSAKFWNQNTQLRYTPRGVTFSSFKFRPQITAAFERYTAIMLQYQEKYPALLASLALTRQAVNIPFKREEEETMVCMVCYDDIPVSRMIFCSAHELPTDPTSPTEILKKEPSSSLDIDLNADQLPTSATAMETRESEANVATNLEDGAYGQSDELEYTEVKAEVAPTDSDDDIMIVEVQGDIQYVGEVIKDDPENVIATEEPKSPVSDDSSGAANVNQLENPVDVKAEEMDEVGAIEILPPNSEIQEEKCNNLKETMKDEPTVDREESPIRRYLDDTTDEDSTFWTQPNTKADEAPLHAFCRTCIRGSAAAATTDTPLAPGGLGLKCMAPDCSHILHYRDIRRLIPRDVRKKLEERILQENLGNAHIINLERCKHCNFAIEMEDPIEVNKVFECYNCKAKICRICDRDWDEDHFGLTCDELDAKKNKDRRDRDLERRMNEAVVRKCPKCGLAFMKSDGCNKMTCRCGMKMCYLCRETKINYDHFCQHLRDPTVKNWVCKQCNKPCLLYEDANKKDDNDLDRIRSEATAKETAGEGSAADGPSTSAATQTATESIAGPFGAINNVNVPLGGVIVNPNANLPPVGNNPIGVEARRLADRLRDPNLPRLQRNLYLRQLQQLQQQQIGLRNPFLADPRRRYYGQPPPNVYYVQPPAMPPPQPPQIPPPYPLHPPHQNFGIGGIAAHHIGPFVPAAGNDNNNQQIRNGAAAEAARTRAFTIRPPGHEPVGFGGARVWEPRQYGPFVPEIPTVPQVVNQRDPRVGAFGGGNGDGNPIVANEPRNVAEGAGAQIAVNNNNGEENAPAMPPQPGFAVAENPLHQAQAIYDGLFNDIGHYFNYQPPQQHYYQIQQPYHHPQPHGPARRGAFQAQQAYIRRVDPQQPQQDTVNANDNHNLGAQQQQPPPPQIQPQAQDRHRHGIRLRRRRETVSDDESIIAHREDVHGREDYRETNFTLFNDPSSESDDEDDPELWADPIAPVDPVPGPGPNTRAHRARDREDRRRVRFDRRNRKRAMDPLKDLFGVGEYDSSDSD